MVEDSAKAEVEQSGMSGANKHKTSQSLHLRTLPANTPFAERPPLNGTQAMPGIDSGLTNTNSREKRLERGEYRILCIEGHNKRKCFPHSYSKWQVRPLDNRIGSSPYISPASKNLGHERYQNVDVHGRGLSRNLGRVQLHQATSTRNPR